MKSLSLISLFVLTLSTVAAQALPFVFEKSYTNYAWGYQHKGCMIDELKNIYSYDVAEKKAVTLIGAVNEVQFNTALDLLVKASAGKMTVKHQMADAGTFEWVGFSSGKEIQLQLDGDFLGINSAPEAKVLAEMLDQWCAPILNF